jgi:hypothetical protein
VSKPAFSETAMISIGFLCAFSVPSVSLWFIKS